MDFDIQDYNWESVSHRWLNDSLCVCMCVYVFQVDLYKVNFLWINLLTQSSSKKFSPLEYFDNYT